MKRKARVFAVAWLIGLSACHETHSPSAHDKNTNWLQRCDDSSACGGALECMCGVCTIACESALHCAELAANAVCASVPGEDESCPSAICLSAGSSSVDEPRPSLPDADVWVPVDTTAPDGVVGEPAVHWVSSPPAEAPPSSVAEPSITPVPDAAIDASVSVDMDASVDSGTDSEAVETPTANGDLITFAFAGTVDGVTGSGALSDVSIGDAITGSFAFDPSALDARGAATFASYYYDNVPGQFVLAAEVGALHIFSDERDAANFSTVIDVHDNDPPIPGSERDRFGIHSREGRVAELEGWNASVRVEVLTFTDLDVFTSTELPTSPPELSRFEDRRIEIMLSNGGPLWLAPTITIRGVLSQLEAGSAQELDAGSDAAVDPDPDAGPQNDDLVTFAFTAQAEDVRNGDAVTSGVAVGDAITGTFSFDPGTIDGRGAATFASYYYDNWPGEFELTATVGPLHITSAEQDQVNFSTVIDVLDDDPPTAGAVPRDAYRVHMREGVTAEIEGCSPIVEIEMVAFSDLAVLTDTQLPLVPPALSRFEERRVSIDLGCGMRVSGPLLSLELVP